MRGLHCSRIAIALMIEAALGLLLLGGLARAQRFEPDYARPLPGQAEYPVVHRPQKWALGREIVRSSLRALVHHPLASGTLVVKRGAERLAVRVRELTTILGSARAMDHRGKAGDGQLDGGFGSPLMPAAITLLPSSESALQSLLGLVASAKHRIDLMIYGWEDDPTGRAVGDALEAAARRGVSIRLLVDRGGFLLHNPGAVANATFLDRLRTIPGIAVIEPENPFVRFDHRKLAVIDGAIAWTGGMILTEVARRDWENLAFLVEGQVVDQYAALFEERWRVVGGAPGGPSRRIAAAPASAPNATVRLIRTDDHERSLKNTIYHAIDHARHHLYLENPYFSDTTLAEKLVKARARGVDVRVVLTLRGNIPRLNKYGVLTTNRLVRGGVRVYLAPGMTHVKAMSADGVWAYIGTGNFDELSLRNNREAGLSVFSPGVVSSLDGSIFLPDMARAEEVLQPLPLPPLDDQIKLELLKIWF